MKYLVVSRFFCIFILEKQTIIKMEYIKCNSTQEIKDFLYNSGVDTKISESLFDIMQDKKSCFFLLRTLQVLIDPNKKISIPLENINKENLPKRNEVLSLFKQIPKLTTRNYKGVLYAHSYQCNWDFWGDVSKYKMMLESEDKPILSYLFFAVKEYSDNYKFSPEEIETFRAIGVKIIN